MINFSNDKSIMYCGIIFRKVEPAVAKGEKKKPTDDQLEEEVVHLAIGNRGCEECITLCLGMFTGTEFFHNLNQPSEEEYNLVVFSDYSLDHLNLEGIIAKAFPRIKLITREFYYDLTLKRAKYEVVAKTPEPVGNKKKKEKEKEDKNTKETEKKGLGEISILVCAQNETILQRSIDTIKDFSNKIQVSKHIISPESRYYTILSSKEEKCDFVRSPVFVGLGTTENILDFTIDSVGILGILFIFNNSRKGIKQISGVEVAAVLTLFGASCVVLPKSEIEISKAIDMLKVLSNYNLSEGVFRLMEKIEVKIYGNNVFCTQTESK
jgi:hypothetical protein